MLFVCHEVMHYLLCSGMFIVFLHLLLVWAVLLTSLYQSVLDVYSTVVMHSQGGSISIIGGFALV